MFVVVAAAAVCFAIIKYPKPGLVFGIWGFGLAWGFDALHFLKLALTCRVRVRGKGKVSRNSTLLYLRSL